MRTHTFILTPSRQNISVIYYSIILLCTQGLREGNDTESWWGVGRAGKLDEAALAGAPDLNVSYKPQKISPKFQGTVRQLLHKRIRESYIHPQFVSDVMKNMVGIIDNVQNLSGGELQRLAICLALGTPADVYLIGEPRHTLMGPRGASKG